MGATQDIIEAETGLEPRRAGNIYFVCLSHNFLIFQETPQAPQYNKVGSKYFNTYAVAIEMIPIGIGSLKIEFHLGVFLLDKSFY